MIKQSITLFIKAEIIINESDIDHVFQSIYTKIMPTYKNL